MDTFMNKAMIIGGIALLVFLARKLDKQEQKHKENLYNRYIELYESGELYKDNDLLYRCLLFLGQTNKEDFFSKVWLDMPPHQQDLMTRRIMKEAKKKKRQNDSENTWQTAAYPADDGDGGE